METKGLLFIPDISGFTRFVNETEIDHSRLIVQELLEILINANQIGLQVSEIEGDAILFYKYGESPDLKEIYRQVEKMFTEFHKYIQAYDLRKYCQCKACLSAIGLTLKVITHYGEFTSYNVKNFNKLIGKDVIVAHQLLKNSIDQHEYWLVTRNLLQERPASRFAEWMEWMSSTKQTESGEIPFHYTQLSPLKREIPPDTTPSLLDTEFSRRAKMFSVSRDYETDIITLFHAAGDFSYRNRWQEGVKAVEEVSHFLPRIGMKCRYILDDGEVIIQSSSYSYDPERIQFSETDDARTGLTSFTLEQRGPRTTLTIDYYLKKNIVREAIFALTKKRRMEDSYRRSLGNLDSLVKEIKLPE